MKIENYLNPENKEQAMKLERIIRETTPNPRDHLGVLAAEHALSDVVAATIGPTVSTGSSVRATYVPREGLPKDYDLRVLDPENRSLDELAAEIEERKDEMEAVLSTVYGRDVELETERAWEREGVFKQIQLAAKDARTGNPLIGIDLNFDTEPHETAAYNNAFAQQIAGILSGLPEADRVYGAQWLLANIRALKHVLSEGGVYNSKDGGFGGVGTEQLMLQLHGGAPVSSLDELQDKYNVGEALHIAAAQDKLEIYHPTTGGELTHEKLSRHNNAGYEKLRRLAAQAEEYLPEQ